VDPSNQDVWVLFDMCGKPFGIINIYASNNAYERCPFVIGLPSPCPLLLGWSMETSIWLKNLLIRNPLTPFDGIWGKENPGFSLRISSFYMTPTPALLVMIFLMRNALLGPISRVVTQGLLKGWIEL